MQWRRRCSRLRRSKDSHTAYLEARLKGISLPDIGEQNTWQTLPPLTPTVPFTSQQGETADSVTSVTCKRDIGFLKVGGQENPSTMLLKDTKYEKCNKNCQSKIDDKGKLPLQHIIYPGTASSIGRFVDVPPPPPLSLCTGHVALGTRRAMGEINGHMKLEQLASFIGKGFPIVLDWLEGTANQLELSLEMCGGPKSQEPERP